MQKPISPETASCSEGAVLNVDDPLEQDQDDDDDLHHKKYSCGVSCHVVLPLPKKFMPMWSRIASGFTIFRM